MRTGRGFERLMTFADAVVAIALTLLVLPLTEIVPDLGNGQDVGDVLSAHDNQIAGFVLSFVVIWVLWSLHHRTMEHFDGYDGVLLRLTALWLFTIVVLPFTTQLLASDLYERGAPALYDGVLLVSSLSLAGMSWWGKRHPELLHADRAEVREWVHQPVSLSAPIVLAVALVLSIFVPAVGTWPLLALVLDDRLENLWLRLRRRRSPQLPSPPRRAARGTDRAR